MISTMSYGTRRVLADFQLRRPRSLRCCCCSFCFSFCFRTCSPRERFATKARGKKPLLCAQLCTSLCFFNNWPSILRPCAQPLGVVPPVRWRASPKSTACPILQYYSIVHVRRYELCELSAECIQQAAQLVRRMASPSPNIQRTHCSSTAVESLKCDFFC